MAVDPGDYYDEFPDHYRTNAGAVWTATPARTTRMRTMTTSPRSAAQTAVDYFLKKKPRTNNFKNGHWVLLEDYGVYVIEVPERSFLIAWHEESLRLFRSATHKSSRMTPTTLRTIVDPLRTWLTELFRDEIPGGEHLLAVERGDTSILDQRAADARQRKAEERQRKAEEEARRKEQLKTPSSSGSALPPLPPLPAPGIKHMALIDVETTTKRVILESKINSIQIDKRRFLALLKSAGADFSRAPAKSVKFSYVLGDGEFDQHFFENDGESIKITWTEDREVEETA